MPLPQPLVWCLRITLALQCIGAAWIILVYGTAINTQFYIYWEYSESLAYWIDRISAWLLIAVAVGVLAIRSWWVLIPALIWTLANSLAEWSTADQMYPWLSPFAHAARYGLPVALGLLICCVQDRMKPAIWILRITLGTTFIAHGLEAVLHYPVFVDYILGVADRLFNVELSESFATSALTVMGIIDVIVAVLIVAVCWPWVAAYMAFWGLITALSRVVHFGWSSWAEVLIRMSHVGVPVVLFLYWRMQRAPEE